MNTKLKCLLLDDELPGLTYLKMLCEQIPELEVVKAFDSSEKLLEELPKLDFDFCILDIEMPAINGLQVANLLHGKPVIFTTAYKDYAVEAFDVEAIDYIIKPIKKERLLQAVKKALLRIDEKNKEKNFIQLNTDKGKALLFFDQLYYVKTSETDSRDKIAYLIDGSFFVLKNVSFNTLLNLLPSHSFCRINKKEAIAIKIVQAFSFDQIVTTIQVENKKSLTLTLSSIYRTDFLEKVKL